MNHLKASNLKVSQLIMQLAGFLRMDLALSASIFSYPITKLIMRYTQPALNCQKLSPRALSPIEEQCLWHQSPWRQSLIMAELISEPSLQRCSRKRCWAVVAARAGMRQVRERRRRVNVSLKWPAMILVFVKIILQYAQLRRPQLSEPVHLTTPFPLFFTHPSLSFPKDVCPKQFGMVGYIGLIIILSVCMSLVPRRKRITKHTFLLTGGDRLYFKQDTEVSFRPLPRKKNSSETNPRSRSVLPTFVNDRKFFTYAFKLPSEAPDYDDEMLEDHRKRAGEACLELSQMLYPKPRSKNKYCGVCRGHYQDYKEHVESEPHLTALKKSPYQLMIQTFCSRIQTLLQVKEQEVKAGELMTMQQNSQKSIENFEIATPSKSTAS